jgi:hypothetical protein
MAAVSIGACDVSVVGYSIRSGTGMGFVLVGVVDTSQSEDCGMMKVQRLGKYVLPGFLLLYFVYKLFGNAFFAPQPMLQTPYDGFISRKPTVRLVWHDNQLQPPFQLYVRDSNKPADDFFVDMTVDGTSYNLTLRDPGKTWVWYVEHVQSGTRSAESTFGTLDYLFKY